MTMVGKIVTKTKSADTEEPPHVVDDSNEYDHIVRELRRVFLEESIILSRARACSLYQHDGEVAG